MLDLNLSLSLKVLIVSAFIVGHNSPKDDLQHMVGLTDKRKRKHTLLNSSITQSFQFNLDRLLSIFSIVMTTCGIKSIGSGSASEFALSRSQYSLGNSKTAEEINSYYGDAQVFSDVCSFLFSFFKLTHFFVGGDIGKSWCTC